ncbi:MAG: radical SAM protein [Peptostreptococcaceae bacterium]
MKDITLLIKPSSSNCNLSCKYCFYDDVAKNRSTYSYGFMDIDTITNIIKNTLSLNISTCNFMFQGGEPTLNGVDFYKKIIELQNKFNINNIKITNSIQTNGVNINNEFAKFLGENNFLVGISLDGPRYIHDLNRIDSFGNGSFDSVMDCIDLLKNYNVNFNILCVITNQTSKHIRNIYDFFKDNNFKYLQFIPCIKKFDDNCTSLTSDIYLDIDNFYDFLDILFNLWYEDLKNNNFIYINTFIDYINVLEGYFSTSCGMGGFCSLHMVIESNGDVFPCDFYCVDYWKLGNINNETLNDIMICDKAKSFFNRSLYIHNKCKICKYFKLCGGGCRRNLEPFVNNIPSFNYQCSSIIKFFDKNIHKFMDILHTQ